ncbi:Superfamily II DNA and RNA helicase [Candidatus Regiella insecticola 5.15]|uniref:Superfamily II DNA and RNA helicase n=1 Tax=Candidatus Regiella insecticola 5.15 TaxID=1005043 RepID=G2GYV2_9ENTR|nr:ATP-dependent RNA helicase DbpA [Candidatus Regiella insecticola]EGY29086.1 Superfamily II DNA and RNA helicase [Candidatus Regiella insecticola 5.15]
MSINPCFFPTTLPSKQLTNLNALGYSAMTPIQAATLPAILKGQDVRAQAKTGSGKTAAFGIGLLDKIAVEQFITQALILCPTRELADQISKELRRLARFTQNIKILTLCGGQSIGCQLDSLVHAPHVVVGTPGRIQEHLRKHTLVLTNLKVLVLDEADRMLDMGFNDAIDNIINYAPKTRQTLLFSATYPDSIEQISNRIQHQPLSVVVSPQKNETAIEQLFYESTHEKRLPLLIKILKHYQPDSCLIFCNTKLDCQRLYQALKSCQMSVLALHGDLDQHERDQVWVRFANHSCRILIATDVAARGLDIKQLALVVNFEVAFDPEVYIHRIGRTGRAGIGGCAVTLCTPQEMHRAHAIEDYLQTKLTWLSPEKINDTTDINNSEKLAAEMMTLCIDGGRKAKIRPGDILGALTGEAGLAAADIGKIDTFALHTYVAIRTNNAQHALQQLQQGKIKGKNYKVRLL